MPGAVVKDAAMLAFVTCLISDALHYSGDEVQEDGGAIIAILGVLHAHVPTMTHHMTLAMY